jgi:hypothetical protein
MTAETAIFTCSICGEPSHEICVSCTKDVCANHRCERCKRCSDCCECEVPLSAEEAHAERSQAEQPPAAPPMQAAVVESEPEPEIAPAAEPIWEPPANPEI